jgi:predicted PurR-regulated permease PerM
MLKVFNSHAISRNQRFTKAILWGVPTALITGIVYGFISYISPFEFSIVYISSTLMLWLSANIGTLIGLLFRVAGVYFAYTNSRIV